MHQANPAKTCQHPVWLWAPKQCFLDVATPLAHFYGLPASTFRGDAMQVMHPVHVGGTSLNVHSHWVWYASLPVCCMPFHMQPHAELAQCCYCGHYQSADFLSPPNHIHTSIVHAIACCAHYCCSAILPLTPEWPHKIGNGTYSIFSISPATSGATVFLDLLHV